MRRHWIAWLLTVVLAAAVGSAPASAATKTVYIPARWAQTGEVPWSQDRTKQSDNFILLWGERSGTNPVTAPSPYNAGLTHASAGTFWETSAEFMAMQVYPDGGAGDLTRFLRTENLAYSQSLRAVHPERVRRGLHQRVQRRAGERGQPGTPNTVHRYAFLDGYTKNYRYPYEFRISGATPSGHEPGYQKPAASGGGHWHSNGGGWVDNRASVESTVYVGPRAAVFGSSRVSGNVRIEDLAWVNSGATLSGNVIVKNNAIVQGGANLSGSVVLGGDAEMWITCSAGTYLLFNPDRGCDGRAGEADINPPHGTFTDEELAITIG